MYHYGAAWTGTDISPEQIDFPDCSFDAVTACQCFWYFDPEVVMPKIHRLLKPGGKLLILYMAWLPYEDRIAKRSEELVLKYSPRWTGAGETRHPISIPDAAFRYFEPSDHEEYDLMVPFTKDSWHGRMRACRGVGASLSEGEPERWDREHRKLLDEIAPEQFEVLHYAALAVLRKKDKG